MITRRGQGGKRKGWERGSEGERHRDRQTGRWREITVQEVWSSYVCTFLHNASFKLFPPKPPISVNDFIVTQSLYLAISTSVPYVKILGPVHSGEKMWGCITLFPGAGIQLLPETSSFPPHLLKPQPQPYLPWPPFATASNPRLPLLSRSSPVHPLCPPSQSPVLPVMIPDCLHVQNGRGLGSRYRNHRAGTWGAAIKEKTQQGAHSLEVNRVPADKTEEEFCLHFLFL